MHLEKLIDICYGLIYDRKLKTKNKLLIVYYIKAYGEDDKEYYADLTEEEQSILEILATEELIRHLTQNNQDRIFYC